MITIAMLKPLIAGAGGLFSISLLMVWLKKRRKNPSWF